MGRKVRIESDDVLIIRTAPIFQPLLAPARYKDSAQRLAMYPANAAHSPPRRPPPPPPTPTPAPDRAQAHSHPTDHPPPPPTRAGAASPPRSRPARVRVDSAICPSAVGSPPCACARLAASSSHQRMRNP